MRRRKFRAFPIGDDLTLPRKPSGSRTRKNGSSADSAMSLNTYYKLLRLFPLTLASRKTSACNPNYQIGGANYFSAKWLSAVGRFTSRSLGFLCRSPFEQRTDAPERMCSRTQLSEVRM